MTDNDSGRDAETTENIETVVEKKDAKADKKIVRGFTPDGRCLFRADDFIPKEGKPDKEALLADGTPNPTFLLRNDPYACRETVQIAHARLRRELFRGTWLEAFGSEGGPGSRPHVRLLPQFGGEGAEATAETIRRLRDDLARENGTILLDVIRYSSAVVGRPRLVIRADGKADIVGVEELSFENATIEEALAKLAEMTPIPLPPEEEENDEEKRDE